MSAEFVRLPLASGKHKSFKTANLFEKWVSEAWRDWQWFLNAPANVECIKISKDRLRVFFDRVQSVASGEGRDERIRNITLELFPRGITLPDELAIVAIRDHFGLNLELAAAAVGAVVYTDTNSGYSNNDILILGNAACVEGIAIANAARRGLIGSDRVALRRALVDAAERMGEFQAVQAQKIRDLQVEADSVLAALRAEVAEVIESASANVNSTLEEFRGGASESISKITSTDAQFAELMRLKAPMDLWDRKAKDHRIKVRTYRWSLSIITLGAVAVLAIVYAVGWIALDRYAALHPAGSIAMTFYVAGFIGAVTAVALWFIRIVVRLYMSQHHMVLDAEERASLIRTYLALSERGAVSEEERALVLAAVFRPTPDGIVKDDGAPQLSPASLLAGMLDRR